MKKILFILVLILSPLVVFGQSTVHISPSEIRGQSDTYAAGQEVPITVRVDTHGGTISVAEGVLSFPSDDLKVKSISKEGSIFSLWVEDPNVVNNTIRFVGGIFGGFNGNGTIFTVVFETKTDKTAHVLFREEVRVLSFAAEPKETIRQVTDAWYPFKIPSTVPLEFTYGRDLSKGNRNLDVAYIQICLTGQDVYSGEITGRYDNATREGILAFQKSNGLANTGEVDATTNQKLEVVCEKTGIPAKLFDINFEVDDLTVSSSDELSARVIFLSFGRLSTPVDLTFSIVKVDTGEEVHYGTDYVVIETEKVLRKKFPGLNLPVGNYNLVVTTLYNETVSDEFSQPFTIVLEEKAGISIWIWIILVPLLLIFGAIVASRSQWFALSAWNKKK